MITLHDLEEAIAECQGQPHPNSNTCIKLAAFLTIKYFMFDDHQEEHARERELSYSAPHREMVSLNSGSEFAKKINGMPVEETLALFDEVMDTLQAVNPRLYAAIMRKL